MNKAEELQNDVENWIHNFVSVYNEQLENIPCPFAKQAVIRNQITYEIAKSVSDLDRLCMEYKDPALWEIKEVLVIGLPPDLISAMSLVDAMERLNKEVLIPAGLIALEDHPDNKEVISDVEMNQGKWALVLIQSKYKLNNASRILERQGYYKKWTKEQLDEVVNWR
jgi:hypothetical protein